MKIRILYNILAIFLIVPVSSAATGINIFNGPYSAKVDYELYLPNAEMPVVYELSLLQQPGVKGDSISPCNYLVISSPKSGENEEISFISYFDGNFYKLKDDRLYEWHKDSTLTSDVSFPYKNELFTTLLPSYINDTLERYSSDPGFSLDISTSGRSVVVSGEENRHGYTIQRFEYKFDTDGHPLSSEITYNPGGISEQTVVARYNPLPSDSIPLSEEYLSMNFPEAFSSLRASNFSLKSLIGRLLPSFSGLSPEKQRYSHRRGEKFERQTIIIVTGNDRLADIIKVRNDLKDFDVIYIFIGNNIESINEVFGSPLENEIILTGNRSITRDFGVTELPAIILCNQKGRVIKADRFLNQNILNFVDI